MEKRNRFQEQIEPIMRELHFASVSFTRQESDALDLLQEALTRAFRSFDKFRPGSNLKAWLFTIMRNITIDRARHRKFEPITFDEEPTAAAVTHRFDKDLPWEQLVSDDMLKALRKLSPRQRLLVFLCDVEGLSYQEIAEILKIPIGTVMSGLHAARTRLRENLLKERKEKATDRIGRA